MPHDNCFTKLFTMFSSHQGALMRKVNENKILRVAALNASNQRGDDVTGQSTGGIENFLIAFENHFQIVNLYNGVVAKTYFGDVKGSHLGDLVGHTKTITCAFYWNNKAYT